MLSTDLRADRVLIYFRLTLFVFEVGSEFYDWNRFFYVFMANV